MCGEERKKRFPYISRGLPFQLFNRSFKNDFENYAKAVHEALYRNVDVSFSKLRNHSTLSAIASLVMASRRGSASEIITFNFDNILELYLRYHGFVTRSVFNDQFWFDYSDVTIYHPHGFLPFEITEGFSSNLVFDQRSYSLIQSNAGRIWRSILYNIMFHRTCLFIGLSGKDSNLKRLLSDTALKHASQKDNVNYWGIAFSTEDDAVIAGNWEENGIFYKKINDYDKELPEFLFSICQEAVSLV